MKHVKNQISLPSRLQLCVSIAAIFQLCRHRTLAVFLIYLSFPIWSQCLSPVDFTFGSVSSVSSNLDSVLVQALLTSFPISLMSISYPSCSSCILLLNSFLGTIFILLLEWLKTELISVSCHVVWTPWSDFQGPYSVPTRTVWPFPVHSFCQRISWAWQATCVYERAHSYRST